MGALSPRRRRCSSALQKEFRVLAAMFFYGLILWHCGTIRFASRRLFLPTFSGAAEKVGLRSNGCGVTAFNSSPVKTNKRGRCGHRPLRRWEIWRSRKSRSAKQRLRPRSKFGTSGARPDITVPAAPEKNQPLPSGRGWCNSVCDAAYISSGSMLRTGWPTSDRNASSSSGSPEAQLVSSATISAKLSISYRSLAVSLSLSRI